MRDKNGAQISKHNRTSERFSIITFEGAFHGRTLATIAVVDSKNTLMVLAEGGRL